MDTASAFSDVAIKGDIAGFAIDMRGVSECRRSTILDNCLIGSAVGLIGTIGAACTGLAIGWLHAGALAAVTSAFSCVAIYVVTYHALWRFPVQGPTRAGALIRDDHGLS